MKNVFQRRGPFLVTAAIGAVTSSHASAAVVTQLYDIVLNSYTYGSTTPTSLTFPLDVNGDAVSDFAFTHSSAPDSAGPKANVNGKLTLDKGSTGLYVAIVKDTDGVVGAPVGSNGVGNYAEALTPGSTVSSGNTFISLTDAAYDNRLLDPTNATNDGAFGGLDAEASDANGITRGRAFIGFAIGTSPSNVNYGYIALDEVLESGNGPFDATNRAIATITGVSIETVAGASITLPSAVTPEPSVLAGAALAAFGLFRRR